MNHSLRSKRNGVVTVEVALCLPLLLMVLFGCYELAHANMLLHATESAAYEGARVGIVPGATARSIRTAAGNLLHSVGISDFTVSVNPTTIKRETEFVEVTIEVPLARNTSIPPFFVKNKKFTGVCRLSREIP